VQERWAGRKTRDDGANFKIEDISQDCTIRVESRDETTTDLGLISASSPASSFAPASSSRPKLRPPRRRTRPQRQPRADSCTGCRAKRRTARRPHQPPRPSAGQSRVHGFNDTAARRRSCSHFTGSFTLELNANGASHGRAFSEIRRQDSIPHDLSSSHCELRHSRRGLDKHYKLKAAPTKVSMSRVTLDQSARHRGHGAQPDPHGTMLNST